MKRRTVSADDLETMAFAAHAPIEPPGPEGGWATATINGREYRARVGAVPVSCPGSGGFVYTYEGPQFGAHIVEEPCDACGGFHQRATTTEETP